MNNIRYISLPCRDYCLCRYSVMHGYIVTPNLLSPSPLFLLLLNSTCDTSVRTERKRIDWWDIGTRHSQSDTFWLIVLSIAGIGVCWKQGPGTKLEVLETLHRLVAYCTRGFFKFYPCIDNSFRPSRDLRFTANDHYQSFDIQLRSTKVRRNILKHWGCQILLLN